MATSAPCQRPARRIDKHQPGHAAGRPATPTHNTQSTGELIIRGDNRHDEVSVSVRESMPGSDHSKQRHDKHMHWHGCYLCRPSHTTRGPAQDRPQCLPDPLTPASSAAASDAHLRFASEPLPIHRDNQQNNRSASKRGFREHRLAAQLSQAQSVCVLRRCSQQGHFDSVRISLIALKTAGPRTELLLDLIRWRPAACRADVAFLQAIGVEGAGRAGALRTRHVLQEQVAHSVQAEDARGNSRALQSSMSNKLIADASTGVLQT